MKKINNYIEQPEIWLPIINFEGIYEISTHLRVRSIDKIVSNGKFGTRLHNSVILKPQKSKKGYLAVILCNNNIKKRFSMHRLVALHFIPNPYNLPFVDHINGNTSDYRIENLQWINNRDNIIKSHYIDNKRNEIKQILQYTLSGEFIAKHMSIANAQRIFTPNSPLGVIQKHLRNPIRNKSAYGFIWKYDTNSPNPSQPHPTSECGFFIYHHAACNPSLPAPPPNPLATTHTKPHLHLRAHSTTQLNFPIHS